MTKLHTIARHDLKDSSMGREKTLALALVALFVCTPAFAHAHLVTASPPSGGTVSAPPSEVAIDFTEAVEPSFSSIVVKDAKGKRVDKNDVHVASGNAKHLAVSLDALVPGTYKVVWHATSTDTHKTNGSYIFKLTQ